MKIQTRPNLVKIKPYVLHTKQGRFPDFQLLSGRKGAENPHENPNRSNFDEI